MIELNEFTQLGLSEKSLEAIKEKGFKEPTPIQKECIPLLLQEKVNVIGQSQTGTGKTAAFGLPLLEMIEENQREVQAIVLTPTRELAIQVNQEITELAGTRRLNIVSIYGGSSYEQQFRQLKRGADVVVGTPGRILDHIERKTLDLSCIKFCVLDEADEMLDMGFIEDIETILSNTPEDKRMLCFSATMPRPILKLASKFMPEYRLVRTKQQEMTCSLTKEIYYDVREGDKIEALCRVIDRTENFYGIVFCKTKLNCDETGHELISRGYSAEVLHGDLNQKQRELILYRMKHHRINIIVATDVAARGIDIQELTHVINFSIPQDPESYVHRIGRTGRAGKEGTAITFVSPSEKRKFAFIKKITKSNISREHVPTIDDIIRIKKERIQMKLENLIQSEEPEKIYTEIAYSLLDERDSLTVVAKLLKDQYSEQLDRSRYKSIYEVSNTSPKEKEQSKISLAGLDTSGNTRLFFARGRKDGLDKRMLVDYIMNASGMKNNDINNVEVHDEFSFLTVPYSLADKLLDIFASKSVNGRPILVRAKVPQDKTRKRHSSSSSHNTKYRKNNSFSDRKYSKRKKRV